MATDDDWPPKSPHHALLSSPSGRRRYEASRVIASSPKRLPGTPSLLDQLRAARADKDHLSMQRHVAALGGDEEDDDEETLQLKLAAIEAKLKLKKLRQSKAKGDENIDPKPLENYKDGTEGFLPRTQVPLSPSKKSTVSAVPRSPGRVLLGIDKGVSAADVSLRRSKTARASPSKQRQSTTTGTNLTELIRQVQEASKPPPTTSALYIPTFSGRMATMRQVEKQNQEKSNAIRKSRSTNFKVDPTELDQFRNIANDPVSQSKSDSREKSPLRLRSPERRVQNPSTDCARTLEAPNEHISGKVPLRQPPERPIKRPSRPAPKQSKTGDASLFEGFSGLNLSSRILPHTFLKRTLPAEQFRIYRIPDLLKVVHSPAYEIPENVIDYVVLGVICSKSNPRDHKPKSSEEYSTASNDWEKRWDDGSQNRKRFIVFTLTDLKWTVDVYLFGTAVPKFHRLNVGSVIAILNPAIMPPRKGREDTGAFSLSVNNDEDQILEIGKSKDLGFCVAKKRDGAECQQWVDTSKTHICEWHLSQQLVKTRASRMGVNTGSNGFGFERRIDEYKDPGKTGYLDKARQGSKVDEDTGSRFYVSASNARNRHGYPGSRAPIYNGDQSTARMLDADDMDPFVAEGQLSRDKEARMQKRMAAQEKERQIAKRLSQLGSGGGAEYMRQRTADSQAASTPGSQGSILSNGAGNRKATVMNRGDGSSSEGSSEIARKRAAESIRLSPVKKKTRFLTSKGIKEAGRESLGTTTAQPGGAVPRNENDDRNGDEDDDDDLDIV